VGVHYAERHRIRLSIKASVTELAEPIEMSMPTISEHIKVLERYRQFWSRAPIVWTNTCLN